LRRTRRITHKPLYPLLHLPNLLANKTMRGMGTVF
jgi:hypothetical protein